jgi:serine/threonine protein phosphatase 1
MNLLRMFERSSPPAARFPDGRVGYAVGDIHGRADLLAQMMAALEARAARDAGPAGPPVVILLCD